MAVHNHIPRNKNISTNWLDTKKTHKNIPTENIIEDIIYKDSAHCSFIQLAGTCAYALLRKEEHLPSKNRLGLHQSFYIFDTKKILTLKGFLKDKQEGIVR